jgi:GNAT superfamily N-acetyltransferase
MVATLTTAVTVAPFKVEDRGALEAMYERFEPKNAAFGLPPSNELRRRIWLDAVLKGINVVAWLDDHIIGHTVLMPEGDTAEMAVFVHQDARRQGVARQLHLATVEQMKPHGLTSMWAMLGGDNYACRAALQSFSYHTRVTYGAESEMVYKL